MSGDAANLRAVNRKTKNYVIITSLRPKVFSRFYQFAVYSNAAAIVFLSEDTIGEAMPLAGHAMQGLREAGIAILKGVVSPEFIRDLKPDELVVKHLTVHANEAREEAFIAAR